MFSLWLLPFAVDDTETSEHIIYLATKFEPSNKIPFYKKTRGDDSNMHRTYFNKPYSGIGGCIRNQIIEWRQC